jgi:hypothetical protein
MKEPDVNKIVVRLPLTHGETKTLLDVLDRIHTQAIRTPELSDQHRNDIQWMLDLLQWHLQKAQ